MPRRRLGLLTLAVLVALPLAALAARSLAVLVIGSRLRHVAAGRGFYASWRELRLSAPLTIRIRDLTLARRADGAIFFRADTLTVALEPWRLLLFSVRPARIELAHARLSPESPGSRAADSLDADPGPVPSRATAERVRRLAENLTRIALAPARGLPELRLRDVAIVTNASDTAAPPGSMLARLDLTHRRGGIRLGGSGALALEQPVPFDLQFDYGHDDRFAGRLILGIPDSVRSTMDSLIVRVDGTVRLDRHRAALGLGDSTRVWIGRLPLRVRGRLARRGPAVSFGLAADGITEDAIARSIPASLLGPLLGLSVEGSFDYRLDFDLDVARPDSVAFAVQVVPHGLGLNADGTTLPILGLDENFEATIRLPRGRTAVRDLSPANPFFRRLDAIDTLLVHAVVTNEDGGFFRHRGFNLDAVRGAISENLRAGAYRRGAGTITMQLARNLYLGHQRTLSRKAQEVVLAWVLEHLTGVSKERLLEIYLNIVEWGPGIHGAGEAAHYYFDRDPERLTPAEALFLTTLLPSPAKWRYRFDRSGVLRPATRAQMHFIGRAMAGKGWLDLALLPPAESLTVVIRGPARAVLFPDSVGRDSARSDPLAPPLAETARSGAGR